MNQLDKEKELILSGSMKLEDAMNWIIKLSEDWLDIEQLECKFSDPLDKKMREFFLAELGSIKASLDPIMKKLGSFQPVATDLSPQVAGRVSKCDSERSIEQPELAEQSTDSSSCLKQLEKDFSNFKNKLHELFSRIKRLCIEVCYLRLYPQKADCRIIGFIQSWWESVI